MIIKSGRIEKRTQMAMSVELFSMQDRSLLEKTVTENISTHGARVVTQRMLQPQKYVLFSSMGNVNRTQARVVYCQPLAGGRFKVGLYFVETPLNWRTPSDTGLAEEHRKEG
jgi:PilZ domain